MEDFGMSISGRIGRGFWFGAMLLGVLSGLATAGRVQAEDIWDTLKSTSQLHGYVENQEIIRNENYVRDYHVASIRNRIDLQPSGTIVHGLDVPFFRNGSIEYFAELRPGYEGAYDIVTDRFGDRTTGFSGIGHSPFDQPIIKGPGFALLKAFGYNPKRFKFIGSRNFAFPDPIDPSTVFLKRCAGCVDTNVSQNNLRFERDTSNEDYYPIREFYLDVRWDFLGQNWLRIGKQQTVWGKADFFRLQDIVNPVDYAQHFFIEPFEDIRIPEWSANLQHKFGDVGWFRDVAANIVWNFNPFIPVGLGQSGQPWAVAFGDEKRSFDFSNGLFNSGLCAGSTTPGCVRKVNFALSAERTPTWNIQNTGIGMKIDWEVPDPQIRFSLTDYWGNRDVPTFALTQLNYAPGLQPAGVCAGMATVTGGTPITLGPGAGGLPITVVNSGNVHVRPGVRPDTFLNKCTFGANAEIVYHKVNTLGLSADYFDANSGLVFRLESSWTHNALTNNTNSIDWTANNDILAYVLGADLQHFIKPLNPERTFFTSFQVFETYYPGASSTQGGRRGIVTGVNDFIFTAFTQTHYYRDQIIPLMFAAFGTEGTDATIGGDVEYLYSDHWSARIGADAFVGKEHTHDVGPYAAFNGGNPFSETVFGYAHEQAGGAQRNKMDEFWFRVRYRF
jgi:uncharacterized protein DUF1302